MDGKFCTGTSDFLLANRVAVAAGLSPYEVGPDLETCTSLADGINDECEGCGKLIGKGAPIYWVGGSYEYPDDGSYMGSMACAAHSWMSTPGTWQWFLECMGWCFEDERPGKFFGPYQWVLYERDPDDECGRIAIAVGTVGAKQGPGPTFRKHLALARKLAKRFRSSRKVCLKAARDGAFAVGS